MKYRINNNKNNNPVYINITHLPKCHAKLIHLNFRYRTLIRRKKNAFIKNIILCLVFISMRVLPCKGIINFNLTMWMLYNKTKLFQLYFYPYTNSVGALSFSQLNVNWKVWKSDWIAELFHSVTFLVTVNQLVFAATLFRNLPLV